MKKLVLIAVFLLGFSMMAVAQDIPTIEIFGGYSFVRVDTTTAYDVPVNSFDLNLNGWNAAVTFNGSKWLGFVADFSGVYGSVDLDGNTSVRNHSIMIGPRVSVRKGGNLTPFFQALFGYTHGLAKQGSDDVFKENDFAMAYGGGLDVSVNSRISVRPIQLEWFTAKSGQTGEFSNNLRYTAGVVFKFGKR